MEDSITYDPRLNGQISKPETAAGLNCLLLRSILQRAIRARATTLSLHSSTASSTTTSLKVNVLPLRLDPPGYIEFTTSPSLLLPWPELAAIADSPALLILASTCLPQPTPQTHHYIPLDLQLPTHEHALCVRFSVNQLLKVRIREHQSARCLPALGRQAPSRHTLVFQVDVPTLGLALWVLEREGEDAFALFDGCGLFLGVRREGLADDVEGCGGREVVCDLC